MHTCIGAPSIQPFVSLKINKLSKGDPVFSPPTKNIGFRRAGALDEEDALELELLEEDEGALEEEEVVVVVVVVGAGEGGAAEGAGTETETEAETGAGEGGAGWTTAAGLGFGG